MPKDKKTGVFVLHSGGIDSTALIHFYKKTGYSVKALFVDYGQISARNERKAVKMICKHYKIKNIELKVNSDRKFKEGLLNGRNLFLLSSALMYTKMKSGIVAIGIHTGTNYIDCGKGFIENVNRIYKQYTNGKILVGAPFINMTKLEIFQYCNLESIPLEKTYSCENGVFPRCGKCNTCKEINQLYVSKDK